MDRYDESIGGAIRSTLQDAQDLVRGEIALARAELRDEVRRAGTGIAMLTAGALAVAIGVVFLLVAAAQGIAFALAWPPLAGFAVVGAIVLVAAAALAAVGKKRLNGERHMPLTMDTMKENMQWTRARRP